MKFYTSGLFHCVLGGCTLAATLEIRENFQISSPIAFYAMHVVIILGISLFLLTRFRKVKTSRILRDLVIFASLYAIAWTGSEIALVLIPTIALVAAFIVRNENVLLVPKGGTQISNQQLS